MEEMMNTSDAVEEIQYIVVKLGDEQYGIDIRYVDNIVRLSKITRVAKSQPYYVGVINLRGEVVPIMSLRRRLVWRKMDMARLPESLSYGWRISL